MYAIGCDVGSQSLKGVLIAPDGTVAALAAASYPVDYPRDVWAEQDPRRWEAALADVVARLVGDGGIAAADVGAIGLATQVDGVVLAAQPAEPGVSAGADGSR